MTDVYEGDLGVDAAYNDLDAESLVRSVVDIVRNAKSMPLSSSAIIGREEVLELLVGALERMPTELREARWLLREREEFMAERAREAEMLMEEVRAEAERKVSRTEIVRQANQVAQRILDDANDEARRIRHETEDYCDRKLASMQIVLDRIMRTVDAGRERLQAIEAPTPDDKSLSEEGAYDSGDEGFFDQDLT